MSIITTTMMRRKSTNMNMATIIITTITTMGKARQRNTECRLWSISAESRFDFNKFDYMMAKSWPKNIIRSKGVLYFSNNRDMSLLFETAGRQKNLKEAGYWFATAPKEELEVFMQRDPGLRRDWDETYGDRMDKIVIIGQHLDRKAITKLLDDCLAD